MLTPSRPPRSSEFSSSRRTYIPQRVQKAMARKMERALPGSMKRYASSYVQQQTVSPTITPNIASEAQHQAHFTPNVVIPQLQQQNHFQPPEEQPPAQPPTPATPPSMAYPASSAETQPAPPTQEYDFIVNPEQPGQKKLQLPGSFNSTIMRIGLVAGGLLVLLIIFVLVRGLLGGSSNVQSFVTIAQDQQELVHLANNANEQKSLSTTNQNFAITAQLSLKSSQSETIKYLSTNGKKVNAKTLSLKISPAIDAKLKAASAATTYNQTFQEIMKTKLTAYTSDLQQSFDKTKGKKGRALLNDHYTQAQLLLVQLNAPVE